MDKFDRRCHVHVYSYSNITRSSTYNGKFIFGRETLISMNHQEVLKKVGLENSRKDIVMLCIYTLTRDQHLRPSIFRVMKHLHMSYRFIIPKDSIYGGSVKISTRGGSKPFFRTFVISGINGDLLKSVNIRRMPKAVPNKLISALNTMTGKTKATPDVNVSSMEEE